MARSISNMANVLGIPNDAKIENINLSIANNGGVILNVEHKIPANKGKNQLEMDWRWSNAKGAYNDFDSALADLKAAAAMMGVSVDSGEDMDEDEDTDSLMEEE